MTRLECHLAQPVMQWLSSRGFTPYGEVGWGCTAIDVVGISDDAVEAVELKLCLTRHLIRQALRNQLTANRSWCAVNSRPRNFQKRIRFGLGLLVVTGDSVEILVEAEARPEITNLRRLQQLRGRRHYREPFGQAGVPTMQGIGVAQAVYDAVVAFRAGNPAATWEEIYEEVPNHYAHARSMQGAMRNVGKNRKLAI